MEPKLKDAMARAVFTVARPSIDANKGRRANGQKGGRPPKKPMVSDSENLWFSKAESTETETDTGATETDTGATETDTGATETDTGANGAASPPTRPRFVPPTLEEVTAYVRKRGSKVDPQGFIDFYAAKGWLIGKTPMKDWKAACRNAEAWERWDLKPVTGDRDRIKTDADYGQELFFTK